MQDFVHSIQITHNITDNNTLFIKFQWQTETVMFLYWLLNDGIYFIKLSVRWDHTVYTTELDLSWCFMNIFANSNFIFDF
jgi:hypothetical protein